LDDFVRQWIEQAAGLGLGWWQAIIVTMAAAFVLLVLKRGISSVLNAKVPKYEPPPARPPSDGSQPGDENLPDAQPTPPDYPGGYPGGGGG
jgi:hypothetical protein